MMDGDLNLIHLDKDYYRAMLFLSWASRCVDCLFQSWKNINVGGHWFAWSPWNPNLCCGRVVVVCVTLEV